MKDEMIMTLWVLLPIYNEGMALHQLIASIDVLTLDCPVKLVLVDDGSDDAAVETLPVIECPYVVLTHPKNKGLGSAMATGIDYVLGHGNMDQDLLVALDADGSHLPVQFQQLLNALTENKDIVIASRYQSGANIYGLSWLRTFLSQGAGLMYQIFVPIPNVRDYTCGYRLYRLKKLSQAKDRYGEHLITEMGFACMGELLIKLHRVGARCTEIPLQLHYDRKQSSSKMNVLKTIVYTLRMLLKLRNV